MAKRKNKDRIESTAEKTTIETVAVTETPPVAAVSNETTSAVAISESPQVETVDTQVARAKTVDPSKPMPIAKNNVAGIELRIHDRFKQMQVLFRDEPAPEIQEQLKKGGWTHRPNEGVFTKQFGAQGKPLAIVEGKRLYHELTKQMAPETVYQRG